MVHYCYEFKNFLIFNLYQWFQVIAYFQPPPPPPPRPDSGSFYRLQLSLNARSLIALVLYKSRYSTHHDKPTNLSPYTTASAMVIAYTIRFTKAWILVRRQSRQWTTPPPPPHCFANVSHYLSKWSWGINSFIVLGEGVGYSPGTTPPTVPAYLLAAPACWLIATHHHITRPSFPVFD